jgi:hypothetical protein
MKIKTGNKKIIEDEVALASCEVNPHAITVNIKE